MNAEVVTTRAAIDIGGTYTDVVLEHGTDRFTSKVLTTSVAPEEGVLEGLDDVLLQVMSLLTLRCPDCARHSC